MSISFNGTTSLIDKIQGMIICPVDNFITFLAWTYAKGQGENNNGFILRTGFDQNRPSLSHHNAADTLRFSQGANAVNGTWTFPALDNQWNAVAVQLDRSLITNDPTARVNYIDVTATETSTPSIVYQKATTAGYVIGNATTQTVTWDGFLGPIQLFSGSSPLSTSEMDQALKAPGSISRNLILWNHMDINYPLRNMSSYPLNGTRYFDLLPGPQGPWSDYFYNLKRAA